MCIWLGCRLSCRLSGRWRSWCSPVDLEHGRRTIQAESFQSQTQDHIFSTCTTTLLSSRVQTYGMKFWHARGTLLKRDVCVGGGCNIIGYPIDYYFIDRLIRQHYFASIFSRRKALSFASPGLVIISHGMLDVLLNIVQHHPIILCPVRFRKEFPNSFIVFVTRRSCCLLCSKPSGNMTTCTNVKLSVHLY